MGIHRPVDAPAVGRGLGSDGLTSGTLLAVVGAGLLCGAAWQLLYRRDLVDRLTYFSAFFVVGIALPAVLPGGNMTSEPAGSVFALCGVLTGLVYTEQWLRGRAEHEARRQVEHASRNR